MSVVKLKRLGELVTFKRGYDLPQQNRVEGVYPIISSAGISGYHNGYKAEGEGVVTGRYGTLGKMYYVDCKYWPHNTALYVKDFKSNDPQYIYYLLSCLGHIHTSDKSAVPGVNRNELHDMAVPAIEDRQVQIAVRQLLNSLDKKIELNNKINAELEAMAKLIYDYWFVQFDFPDTNGKPYKSSGGKMVYNEELKREIPDGWKVKSLVIEMDVQYGFPFSTKLFNEDSLGSPVVRIRNILDNSISMYSTEEVHEKYSIEKGDLLVGMDGNFHLNFWAKRGCYLNQRCVRIRSRQGSTISHLQALFQIEPYIKAREKNVSRTTVGHLSAKDINDLTVLVSDSKIVNEKCTFFDSILEKMMVNRTENEELINLRDWLLPMLMNGQVTIKEG